MRWQATADVAAALRGRAGVPGRRRRACDAALRRLRRQHRHPGRAQPRLEAGAGAGGPRRSGPACHLRGRAPPGGAGSSSSRPTPGTSHARRRSSPRRAWTRPSRDPNIDLGYRYRSAAVIPDSEDDGAIHGDPRQLRALPGTRAPHVLVDGLSTIDRFGRDFVLLTGDGPRRGRPRDATKTSTCRRSARARRPTGSSRAAPSSCARTASSRGARARAPTQARSRSPRCSRRRSAATAPDPGTT